VPLCHNNDNRQIVIWPTPAPAGRRPRRGDAASSSFDCRAIASSAAFRFIRSLAGARPIPVVLDPTGGAIGSELLSLLSPGGTLIAYVQMASENISVPASAVVNAGVGCAV
jgi:hypothetical protein